MTEFKLPEYKVKTAALAPRFSDGMIVDQEDLAAAVRYPLDMFQMLVCAYFGPGVVCGLNVEQVDNDTEGKSFLVRILPGLALDGNGNPLQLCAPQLVDLTPHPCQCEPLSETLHIVVGRAVEMEMPSSDGQQSQAGEMFFRREREMLHVRVLDQEEFDALGQAVVQSKRPGETPTAHEACDCMQACGGMHSPVKWIWLAELTRHLRSGVIELDMNRRRRFVKPIRCACGDPPWSEKPMVEVDIQPEPEVPVVDDVVAGPEYPESG